jgi:hypothetical protein
MPRRKSFAHLQHMRVGILALLLLSMIACNDLGTPLSTDESSTVVDGVIPFKVGYQWVYRLSAFDTAGQFVGARPDTMRIDRDTMILGERWFITNYRIVETNRNGEVWTIYNGSLRLSFPKTLNDSAYTWGGIYIKLVSTNDTITVPAGVFRSYQYHEVYTTLGNVYDTHFLVPHKGVVKGVFPSVTPSGLHFIGWVSELVSTNVL